MPNNDDSGPEKLNRRKAGRLLKSLINPWIKNHPQAQVSGKHYFLF